MLNRYLIHALRTSRHQTAADIWADKFENAGENVTSANSLPIALSLLSLSSSTDIDSTTCRSALPLPFIASVAILK